MQKKDFYYDLPPELIAQTPLENRLESRLLTLDKQSGQITHGRFTDILQYLQKGDCLVLNDSKVIPARLYGTREKTGASIELLLLKRQAGNVWEALVKPGKRALAGDVISFGAGEMKAEILESIDDGKRLVEMRYEGVFEEILDRLGEMPLPHYITKKLGDNSRYQTVYAAHDGSVAAPTAGLHFTEQFLAQIEEKGVKIARVTLHVGLATFRPVKAENILDHHMHEESYHISENAANIINISKQNGNRVIAVGTTSVRTLESSAADDGAVRAGTGATKMFIYPGYKFKIADKLITNFHLPESTLIMLVSALCGRENVLNAYNEAIKQGYRFFSFGDAMFIV